MMLWALVFAADMAAGLTLEAKNLRRNEMLGDCMRVLSMSGLVWYFRRAVRFLRMSGLRLSGVFSIEA